MLGLFDADVPIIDGPAVEEVLPILREIGFNAFHAPGGVGFVKGLFPDGLPKITAPDETLHDTGGKQPAKWPGDSEVVAKFGGGNAEYRYALVEVWDMVRPLWMWVLMNPSMAGLRFSDSTVNCTGKMSRHHGAGGQIIVNSGAYRATNPGDLIGRDVIGPDNLETILRIFPSAAKVILAYGMPPAVLADAGPQIALKLASLNAPLYFLRKRLDGRPMHPLARGKSKIPMNTIPMKWCEEN